MLRAAPPLSPPHYSSRQPPFRDAPRATATRAGPEQGPMRRTERGPPSAGPRPRPASLRLGPGPMRPPADHGIPDPVSAPGLRGGRGRGRDLHRDRHRDRAEAAVGPRPSPGGGRRAGGAPRCTATARPRRWPRGARRGPGAPPGLGGSVSRIPQEPPRGRAGGWGPAGAVRAPRVGAAGSALGGGGRAEGGVGLQGAPQRASARGSGGGEGRCSQACSSLPAVGLSICITQGLIYW